jgi:hypothetical protein
MRIENLYEEYANGNEIKVWQQVSELEFDSLLENEKKTIHGLIMEVLQRIDKNVLVIKEVLRAHDFRYENFGDLNTLNESYVRTRSSQNEITIDKFYEDVKATSFVPTFFAYFCSYFEVIDFRGSFPFESKILLDPFFIESLKDQQEIEDFTFNLSFRGKSVSACMFSPDHYIKEDQSGDLGACIMKDKKLVVDNYVVNYFDDFNFKFLDYIRFSFHWAGFPNLYWATDAEKLPFNQIVQDVRNSIIKF